MGALDQYNARTRRLLTDAQKQYWSDSDLNDNINQARSRVCGDTKCLRQLVTQILLLPGQEHYNIIETVNSGMPPNLGLQLVELISVTIYWGAMRVICTNRPFTEQSAKLRIFANYRTRPASLAFMGSNTVYLNPVPDRPYMSDWDCVLIPQPLTTNADLEVIPMVFQNLVPWFAAHLSKYSEQSMSESDIFYQKYLNERQAACWAFFGARVRDAYRR